MIWGYHYFRKHPFCLFHGLNFLGGIAFLFSSLTKKTPQKLIHQPSDQIMYHKIRLFWGGRGWKMINIGWIDPLDQSFSPKKKSSKTTISPTCGVILVGVIRGVMPGVDEAAGDMGRGEGQGLLREGQRVDMLLRARCSSSPWWGG